MVAVESSHAMYDRYVFYADMGGVLRCVDTNYLKPVWAVNTGDAVMAAVALDLNGTDGLDLYTANMLSNRKKGGAQIRRYDALSGKEIWTVEIGVAKNTKTKEDVGVKASPVIGQKGLDDLVFFTVTGLDEEGRNLLGVSEETKAAVAALEKETGRIRWAKGLSDRSESSPVAVYDKEGNGWIIQCAEDGTIFLLDGRTGDEQAELKVEGKIKASPAVYNDIMVIGTTGKGTEFVYGIRIR
jgi:outer membrane protein assembly factor BamB